MSSVTPARDEPEPPRPGPWGPGALLLGVGRILGTHAVVALAGLLTLPVLARNLGPALYGTFSVFLTVLGVLCSFDFVRALCIRELPRAGDEDRRRLDHLGAATAWVLGALVVPVGLLLFDLRTSLGLALGVLFHSLASRDFATLSLQGRVGTAFAVRNLLWAAATLVAAALTFWHPGVDAFVWPFAAASGAILLGYRSRVRRGRPVGGAPWSMTFSRRVAAGALRQHRSSVLDLTGIHLAAGAMASTDRLVLERTAAGPVLGEYVAHGDLALKLNLFGYAFTNVLTPYYTRLLEEHGYEVTAARFVRVSSALLAAFFLGILCLVLLSDELVDLFLGERFAGGSGFFALMLSGVFVQAHGYLVIPWQRARGRFRLQQRAYGRAAVLMVVAGLVLIPTFGAAGAAFTYLLSRLGDLELLLRELHELPRDLLPRWRVVAALGMLAAVFAASLAATFGTGA